VLTTIAVTAVVLVGLYLLVPRIAGLEDTWHRIEDGDPWWLALGVALEAVSFAGYVWLLRAVVRQGGREMSQAAGWRLTLAGVAATRIVTVGGAGGIAVTVVGLRDEGFTTREASERQAVDLVLLYAVFFGLIVACGVALAALGEGHPAVTLAPAGLSAVIMVAALAVARVPQDFERRLRGRWGKRGAALAALPAVLADGVRGGWSMLRRGNPAVVGALIWWLADIGVFVACVGAFGGDIDLLVLAMAYLVGHIFNVLPVPGGVGPVEGGMIGAMVAFGEPAGLALVATLAYQLISVWLPAVPGAFALWRVRHHHLVVADAQ